MKEPSFNKFDMADEPLLSPKLLFLAITVLLACIVGCQTVPIEKARTPTLYDSMVEQVAHDERTELVEGCMVLALSGTHPETAEQYAYDVAIGIEVCEDRVTVRHGYTGARPDGILEGMAMIMDTNKDGVFDQGSFMMFFNGILYSYGDFTQDNMPEFLDQLKNEFEYLLKAEATPKGVEM